MSSKINSYNTINSYNKCKLNKFSNTIIPDNIDEYEKYTKKYRNGFKFKIDNIEVTFNSTVLNIEEMENILFEFIKDLLKTKNINKIITKRENIARQPGCGKPLTQKENNDNNENIVCSKCGIEKNKSEYHKRKNTIIKQCKACKKISQKKYYEDNKEKLNANAKIYYKKNVHLIAKNRKEFRANNNDIIRKHNEKYRKKYPERIKASHIKNDKQPATIIQIAARRRFKNLVKCDNHFNNIMKYNKDIYIKWIEYNFDEHMNWQNFGKYWQIDHITPCSSFKLENNDEFLICFNWRNLRPCEKKENLYKSNKIDLELINKFKIKALQFEKHYLENESNN